ncbi:MAG: hypothetical protein ABR909_01375 [Candidatus Bathyarchaeia archaeon]|jgi:hypothetical protein
MSLNQKEFVEELKIEWKKLWRERIDDKVRAEGIAVNDYNQLFIDKGTIIHATRDFKALNFKEILEEHEILNAERYIPPDPHVGGWSKFVKINITSQKLKRERLDQLPSEEKKEKQQLKKNGRGWLHI